MSKKTMKNKLLSIPSVKIVDDRPKKIVLLNGQSPGDITIMAYAIKALHEQYPGKYLTGVDTPCGEIFEGNPHITHFAPNDPEVRVIKMEYPMIHRSNQTPVHFIHSFVDYLADQLNIRLLYPEWQGAIYLREEEKYWYSHPRQIIGMNVPYWIIDAGHKLDFTAKAWDYSRYQEVIDRNPDVWFVQMGIKHNYHYHPDLKGKNLINLVGQTDLRQLIRLVYNSFGVLTPVSLPMVLAYAVPPHPRFGRKSRACIVLSGG